MRSLLFSVFILLTLSYCTHQSEPVAQQQVIPGELPDPSVIEVDGVYYAAGSSNDWGPVYPIYKSTDLENWTFVNYVFQEKPEWTISSYWAPELYYHNGTFYCYYTARRTDGTSVIGVATTQNIEKGFKDKGQLLDWGNEAIDAFVYNEDGTLYVTWKAYGLTPGKRIQILGSELSEDGLSLKGEPFNVVTANPDNWEKGGIEGQSIVKKNGYLYMMYSGNACCGSACNYKIGVARAKSIKGSWEKYDGNPLLEGNSTWKCPGHGTTLQTEDNWYYLYHAYNTQGFPYLGRSPILSKMYWNQETGWPYFKVDSSNIDRTILKENIVDDFDSDKLNHQWRFDIPSYNFETSIKNSQLTLIEESRAENNETGSAVVVNPDYANFTMETTITERNNALKGLTLYATKSNSLGLGIKDHQLVLWKVKDDRFTGLNTQTIDDAATVHLRATVTEGHIATFQYSTDGENWNTMPNNQNDTEKVTGDNLSWWSWGMKAGLFVKTDSVTQQNKAVFEDFSLTYP